MDNLVIALPLLVLWIGAGIFGLIRLEQLGYRLNLMRLLAFYILPVLVVLYVIFYLVQPLDAAWPSNLPGSLVNTLLTIGLVLISPALLAASYLVPDMKG